MAYDQKDTITAIATAPGTAAISVIRISGKDTIEISNKIFSGPVDKYKSHTLHYGKILDDKKNVIDSVLLVVMLRPKSYTGEDSVEIHCHGGSLITQKVLQTVLNAGARAANPGEFTLRAFLNNKIDLLQAEAVQELISANNELALKAAENQLEGVLSASIKKIQKKLIDIAAIIEAWIDFPEEDLEFASKDEIKNRLKIIKDKLEKLSDSFHEGNILFEGINLAIVGTPNVGKSSLLNVFCKKNRAIVTPISGTTRDTIEENIKLGCLHFKIIDTAGIRKTDQIIEKEGIERSKKAIKEADVVLIVLDASRVLSDDDFELLETLKPHKTIVVWNKIDLNDQPPGLLCKNIVHISAKKNIGIDLLKEKIENLIWKKAPPSKDQIIITKLRHKKEIEKAIKSSQNAIFGLDNDVSLEFVVSDLRDSLNKLKNIIGHDVSEDILSSIFSKFCIGK